MKSSRKPRILTGLAAVPIVLAALFGLPSDLVLILALATFLGAAAEFLRIARHWAPSAPLRPVLVLIPIAAVGLAVLLRQDVGSPSLGLWLLAVSTAMVICAALVPMLGGAPVAEAMAAVGIFAFSIPYFAVPAVSFYQLHRLDPWLAFLLAAVVAMGDTAAYFVGSAIGRHKMAPTISPKKSWEGAIGGLAASLLVVVAWAYFRRGEIDPMWLALVAVTSVVAQLGDLVESFLKRGAGVKDSSNLLPGHGGIYDRVDAYLLATPVFALGVWLLGLA